MTLRLPLSTPAIVAGSVATAAAALGDIGVGRSQLRPSAPVSSTTNAKGALLTRAGARRYMLDLVNRDRSTAGLAPVELDEGPATRAGQNHAEDMAAHGYLGHWGSDGSVPEQRFTEAGGVDMVLENASCFTDERPRTLDPDPRIDPSDVERTEAMFFHERPPNDGHRRNILNPIHNKLGVGIAQPVATTSEIPVPCFAQEFVDAYGTYAPLPRALRATSALRIQGSLRAPASPAGVGIARVAASGPIAVGELNRRRSYSIPAPNRMYWPAGYDTPAPVQVAGREFSIDLPAWPGGEPGLYEVSVWASLPSSPDLVMVSLRTIRVQ
jgi:uncharacterized protein YkwD